LVRVFVRDRSVTDLSQHEEPKTLAEQFPASRQEGDDQCVPSDVMGRLGSYAGLLYAADTANPAKAKFYGDVQEKLTAISTDLLFFELELNQIAEADLGAALQVPELAAYKLDSERVLHE
jgi:oligoendopeptidase F